jgi:hypothetical protein
MACESVREGSLNKCTDLAVKIQKLSSLHQLIALRRSAAAVNFPLDWAGRNSAEGWCSALGRFVNACIGRARHPSRLPCARMQMMTR